METVETNMKVPFITEPFQVHMLNESGIKKATEIAERFSLLLDGLANTSVCGGSAREFAILSDVYFDNQCEAGECLYEAGLRRQLKREKSAKRPKRKSRAR